MDQQHAPGTVPRRLALGVVGAFAALASCRGSEHATGPQAVHEALDTLAVVIGPGATGQPTNAITPLAVGTRVSYSYGPMAGYDSVRVFVDGTASATVGVLTLDRTHTIVVSAVPRALVLPPSNAPQVTAAAAIWTSPDPIDAYQTELRSLTSLASTVGQDSAARIMAGVAAVAFDVARDSAAVRKANLALGGSLFSVETGLGVSAAAHVSSRSGATAGPGLTEVIYVNGVLNTPLDAAVSTSQLAAIINAIPSTTQVHVFNFYNESAIANDGSIGACLLNRSARFLASPVDTWPVIGFECLSDFSEAGQQILNVLKKSSDPGSPDAANLTAIIKQFLKSGAAVVLVGHSQGTLIVQQALGGLMAGDQNATNCLGYLEIAAPISATTDRRPSRNYQSLVVEGAISHDIILDTHSNASDDRTGTAQSAGFDSFLDAVANPSLTANPLKLIGGITLGLAYPLFDTMDNTLLHFMSGSYLAWDGAQAPVRSRLQTLLAGVQTSCISSPTISVDPSSIHLSAISGGTSAAASIAISNSQPGTLSGLSVAITYKAGQPFGWLAASLDGTTAPTTLRLATSISSLPAGTYDATISVASMSPGVTNSPVLIPVTLTVSSAPAPVIDSVVPRTMTASQSLNTLSVYGEYFSVTGGQLSFTDPNTQTFSSAAHPDRIVSVSSTQWVYQVNNGGTTGTWHVHVVNADGLHSSDAPFDVVDAPATPAIRLSTTSLSYAATTGVNPALQTVSITNGGSGTLSGLTTSVSYAPGQPTGWLAASLSGTTASAALSAAISSSALPIGTYHATIAISSSAAGVTNSPQTVSVTLAVSPPEPVPSIGLSTSSVSFSGTTAGASPAAQTVQISNSGSGALSGLSSAVSYQNGQPTGWLGATLSTTSAPATLTIAPSTTSLSPGTYGATISVASSMSGVTNSPQTIAVSLVISAPAGPTIVLSPSSLSFSTTRGAVALNNKEVGITNGAGGTLSGLSFSPSYTAGQPTGWLSLLFESGPTAPTTLSVAPVGYEFFDVGTYNATVSIASSTPGVINSPQNVAVTLTILPSTALQLIVSPSNLTFSAVVGGPFPSSQAISLTSSGSSSLQIQSVSIGYVQGGQGWLSASTNSTQTPATITVSAQPAATLAPGTYIAQIGIFAPGASPANYVVTVTMQVSAK